VARALVCGAVTDWLPICRCIVLASLCPAICTQKYSVTRFQVLGWPVTAIGNTTQHTVVEFLAVTGLLKFSHLDNLEILPEPALNSP